MGNRCRNSHHHMRTQQSIKTSTCESRCVERFCTMKEKIATSKQMDSAFECGREQIAEMMSLPGTVYDYRSRFFFKDTYKTNYEMCEAGNHAMYSGRSFQTDETMDRGVSRFEILIICFDSLKIVLIYLLHFNKAWLSCVGHAYYYRVRRYGIYLKHAVHYCMFMSHDCNTTIKIMEIMRRISGKNFNQHDDMYAIMVTEAYKLKKQFNLKKKTIPSDMYLVSDIGSGDSPRFSTSNQKPYTQQESKRVCEMIIKLVEKYNGLMTGAKSMKHRLCVVRDMQKEICVCDDIPGLRSVRALVLIQMLALCGLLHLEFYTHTPMHRSGGCKTFMEECCNYDKTDEKDTDLIDWNVERVTEIQHVYGKDFTPSIYENVTCLIGRKKKRVDIFYQVAWPIIQQGQGRRKGFVDKETFQLFFRYNSAKSSMEVFDGKRLTCMMYVSYKKSKKGLIQWPTNADGTIHRTKRLTISDEDCTLFE